MTVAEPAAMKLKEIKAELDVLGVTWKGVCFERDDLVHALTTARTQGPVPAESAAEAVDKTTAAEQPTAAAPTSAASSGEAYEAAYGPAFEAAMQLKVNELRTALAERSVGWADCLEKTELAARLAGLQARAAVFSASGAISPGRVGAVDAAQCDLELADSRTPLLLDVFATWCGPCKLIAPQLEVISAKLGARARVAKLDSDLAPELSTRLRVEGLPTLIFMRDGQEVHRLAGVPGQEGALEALVEQHLGVTL